MSTETEARWYIIHAYSGHEERVKNNLDQRIATMDVQDKIQQVVIPTEEQVEIKGGRRISTARKVFPGYILVQMVMDDETWYLVRNTPGVTAFVSSEGDADSRPKPVPLEQHEVDTILANIASDQPKVRVGYTRGQNIRIIDGPFVDFMGFVDEVYTDRSKLKVLVSFFGRETPVELDFLQVENV
ncbi:MAG: transcription termination/antitermination protein NusG [Chloroflexota bacterium]|nr:transcription termination/antitermination protein NusG [Chloroflexota bacterium]